MPGRLDRLFDGDDPQTIHATCVALSGRGVLILGASGSGKSSLALQLIALGAQLVADDRTNLSMKNGAVMANAPASISGLIEARGVGLLHAKAAGPTPVSLIVDMDREETERLPRAHKLDLMGQATPVLARVNAPYFPAAIAQYLRHGKQEE